MSSAMFITDFDGTLLSDNKTIRNADLETLAALRRRNIVTAIATGRSLFSFNRALDQIGVTPNDLAVDYLIFSTGAGIQDMNRQKNMLSHALSKREIFKIMDYFDDARIDYAVQDAIPRTEYFLSKSHGAENPDFERRIAFYPGMGQPIEDRESVFEQATEVLAIVPGKISQSKLAEIRHALSEFSVILATSPLDHQSTWVEVFSKAVSKSWSAGWLARKLGISSEAVVAVGNDYNDKDMLEWAGKGFLVANGPDDMKPQFPIVASNNRCGVSDAAEKGFNVYKH